MGCFYHRRSPIDLLYELKGALRPGRPTGAGNAVVPDLPSTLGLLSQCRKTRYAMMRNVVYPDPSTLRWLERCGFQQVRCVDLNQTSLDEQRSTPWMNYQSLADFLDPEDRTKTTEGLSRAFEGHTGGGKALQQLISRRTLGAKANDC